MMTLALLASIFLNGVNVDGVRSQAFEKCRTVKVDAAGDIHLDCPGYQVEAAPAAQAAAPAPAAAANGTTPAVAAAGFAPQALSKRYWLVTEQTEGGVAQYDVDVFINSKWVRKVKSLEGQIVLDVTKYLNAGPNKVLFAATKHLESGRKSTSPAAFVKVIVGEGQAGGNNVMIDNPIVEFRRTAAETDNVNEEFSVQGR